MGFSVSAAAAIIGVAFIMVLEVSMGTILPVLNDLDESYDEMRQRAIDELQTGFKIQNISVQINGSLHDLSIQVKNTGSTVIENSYVSLLINGTLSSFTCTNDYWFPENIYTLSVYGLSGSGEKKIKLIAKNGISDYDTCIV
jgi:archaellum component FlaF (FlaF/FlaG flagellin family)